MPVFNQVSPFLAWTTLRHFMLILARLIPRPSFSILHSPLAHLGLLGACLLASQADFGMDVTYAFHVVFAVHQ